MDGAAIKTRALRISHTNATNYQDADATEDMNYVYQRLVNKIVAITKGDYFWDTGTADTVIWRSEYEAKQLGIDPDDLDIKRVNKVFIKYSDTADYTQARYQNPWALEKHPSYYSENQSISDPFFYIQDESIFIYPAATEVVTDGWQIYVIHSPADISVSSTEDDIEITKDYHYLISMWMAVEILRNQKNFNEANDVQADFDREVQEMIAFIKQRYNQPVPKDFSKKNNYR